MVAEGHRVLSQDPLNAEPAPQLLASSFVTANEHVYHRNHGEFVQLDTSTYKLIVASEVDEFRPTKSAFTLEEIKERFPKQDLVTVLSCAGNRRTEMDHEKEVEGLKWGVSAIANCHFAGALLSGLLRASGLDVDKLRTMEQLHIHFETEQNCQDDSFYAASLPLAMALDPERPTLLAYEMNRGTLELAHGFPLRLVVPGVIGARSVKWLERIIIRDHESQNFYQTSDYKVLPPQAGKENKAEFMKKTPALMEFPLNSVICSPAEDEQVPLRVDSDAKVDVKGYAIGPHGIRIDSVHVVAIPLPVPTSTPTDPSLLPEITSSAPYKIRAHASTLPASAWTRATLDEGTAMPGALTAHDKHWGWTLFSAQVPLSDEIRHLAQRSVEGGAEFGLVAFATDVDGHRQELQTQWNVRGVAEASWSVVQCRLVPQLSS